VSIAASRRPIWNAASTRAALTPAIEAQLRRGRPNADNGILKKVDQPKWGCPIIGFERVRRTKSIHVLVSPLTIADATRKRAQSALCLALNLA
jgi:hypothetical protein